MSESAHCIPFLQPLKTNKQGRELDDLSDEELRRQEGRWKSDVDLKLDRLVAFVSSYEALLSLLLEREKKRAKFWEAVIEKSTTGLIWAGLIVVGTALADWFKRQVKS